MTWTDDMQAVLVKYASDGKSYQDVADELGLTRSAVAGRAGRTGVRFRAPPIPKRQARGEFIANAKLTVGDVRWLRDARFGEVGARARLLGITPEHASAVRTRRSWAHVR